MQGIKTPFTVLPNKVLKNPSVAHLYKVGTRVDLLTGTQSEYDHTKLFEVLSFSGHNKVIHLSYEAGALLNEGESHLTEGSWLALELEYLEEEEVQFEACEVELDLISSPSYREYKKAFDKVYGYLERGDSYQVNLTFPFSFQFKGDLISSFFAKSEKLGEFAHATIIPELDWGILSNSPECLFSQEGKRIETRPIKGTIAEGPGAFEKLSASEKDQAELYMITDLLRNDLNRLYPAAKVEKLKSELKVPGLVHQYSQIALETSEKIALKDVITSLFPGGSVTGAPKIRTMNIINEVESSARGAYCGSTLFINGDRSKASINIRTAELDLKRRKAVYGAGGGITLLSHSDQEYDEMLSKVDSFTLLLQLQNPIKANNFNTL